MPREYSALFGFLLAFWICASARGGPEVLVAVVPFNDLSNDTNFTHWSFTIPMLIGTELSRVQSIRVLPDSAIDYAVRKSNLKQGQLVTRELAGKFGRICHAKHVVWGTYGQNGSDWRLALQTINVATGETSEIRPSFSPQLTNVVNQQVEALLSALKIPVSSDDRGRMRTPLTFSTGALALMGKAAAELNHGGSLDSASEDFRSALLLDPDFAEAQKGLVQCLWAEGKSEEASRSAKDLLTKHPNLAGAHAEVGLAYLNDDLRDLAKEEFARALEMDPTNARYAFLLALVLLQQENWTNAVSVLEKAQKCSPFDANIRAQLGCSYARLERRDSAYEQLRLAETYNVSGELSVEQWLGQGYQGLRDSGKAIEHYATFLSACQVTGVRGEGVNNVRSAMTYLQVRLEPHAQAVVAPHDFTQRELNNALTTRLTPDEMRLVTNPLTPSSQLVHQGHEFVGDARAELDRAKRLFDGLACRLNTGDQQATRTAVEALRDWKRPSSRFNCQDYTVLYVSLARSVGLKAYYVLVRRDASGNFVGHACAVVFIGGTAYLVDSAYDWFGIPHQEYEIEDDLRVVAFYLCQSGDSNKIDIALRIAPDWSELRFDAAEEFGKRGDLKRAKEQTEAGLKLDSQSWRALFAQARMEDSEHNWKAAETHFRQCLAINPDAPKGRLLLARELFAEGDKHGAREELESLLNGNHTPEDGAQARDMIAYLNDQLKTDKER